MPHPDPVPLPLKRILTPRACAARCEVSAAHVADLAEALRRGDPVPPVVVFEVAPKVYWLVSGRHRLEAHRLERRSHINCVVKRGTEQEAALYAAGTNKAALLPRTVMDKRRAVLMILSCPAAAGWSACQVARHAGVSPQLAGAIRGVYDRAAREGLLGALVERGVEALEGGRRQAGGSAWGAGPPALLDGPGPAQEEDEEDLAVLNERIARLLRKYCRYCAAKGASPEAELAAFLAEQAREAEARLAEAARVAAQRAERARELAAERAERARERAAAGAAPAAGE